MVVQHNMQAMNSNRMLGVTTSSQGKTTEKLSSGYKINRAADDAAGLAISEKMRKQARGLERGSMNAQDGVSCVQTAEGALNEVHAMLQRMNELAVQAANGTNSESDRQAIQNEVDQLLEEMDRVSETTKFNETMLLKGDPTGATRRIYMKPYTAGLAGRLEQNNPANNQPYIYYFYPDELYEGKEVNIGGDLYTIAATSDPNNPSIVSRHDAMKKMGIELMRANNIGICTYDTSDVDIGTSSRQDLKFYDSGQPTSPTSSAAHVYITDETQGNEEIGIWLGTRTVPKELTFNLHAGADAALNNKICVAIQSFDTVTLGIEQLDLVGKTGDNGKTATYAIDAIANALQQVSDQRAELGAIQNRLEHSIANLDNVVENTTAAESRIRDTDMAEAMVEYSKNNILAQAGQSMLAQANSSAEGVMALLQ
ncbi:flagellin [Lachnospiraceae bacterium XBD2001]|nr:flagellin [Lachnospiraceae bacterium XBD2001]